MGDREASMMMMICILDSDSSGLDRYTDASRSCMYGLALDEHYEHCCCEPDIDNFYIS